MNVEQSEKLYLYNIVGNFSTYNCRSAYFGSFEKFLLNITYNMFNELAKSFTASESRILDSDLWILHA